ncbi:hypothetical protein Patl1_25012 [Pistacia atlantica]|uniref:Uncharacterized protein n=1 Tax=Pistacia atlantica TaxID=434234 RepID=A0ACC1B4X4_9ROSI|nr:hypothetical protein Patl1_25012 [Pistacia atlantica]
MVQKKKIAVINVSVLIFVALVVAILDSVRRTGAANGGGALSSLHVTTTSKAIKSICQPTDYKETCEKSLAIAGGNLTDPKDLIKIEFKVAIDELKLALKNISAWKEENKGPKIKQAFTNCNDLLESAIEDLKVCYSKMGALDVRKPNDYIQDVKVFLSGAATFQESCFDEFNKVKRDYKEKMKTLLNTSRELTSNGLAMMNDFSSVLNSSNITSTKIRLLSHDEFPSWVNEGHRRLLAETPGTIQADVIVAQDGSGKFKTISEALNLVPDFKNNPTNKSFVIYIKEGIYKEYVTVTKQMRNVMFIGDGSQKTKITGYKNFIDGTNTMNTATVAVLGPKFIAKDIGFENSAGAKKHQAVALRVQADRSIFFNCQMDGYQDTLYAHAHRQYYRDCTITGTIDYIFGDAAAVFQNCKMIFRKPIANQKVIVTAQGRSDKNSVTGLVLQNCTISADPEYVAVKNANQGYLGRPWKMFSRTIYLQSEIDDVIQPDGWLPWNGKFALDTLWYAEYGNRGLGSDTAKRVAWPGIKKLTPEQAADFTIERFFVVDWIKPSSVPYNLGMF